MSNTEGRKPVTMVMIPILCGKYSHLQTAYTNTLVVPSSKQTSNSKVCLYVLTGIYWHTRTRSLPLLFSALLDIVHKS